VPLSLSRPRTCRLYWCKPGTSVMAQR
jgi:hypothetical protein